MTEKDMSLVLLTSLYFTYNWNIGFILFTIMIGIEGQSEGHTLVMPYTNYQSICHLITHKDKNKISPTPVSCVKTDKGVTKYHRQHIKSEGVGAVKFAQPFTYYEKV